MATIEQVRSSIINKLNSIENKPFLVALENLISSNAFEKDVVELSREQLLMLEMSEQDIQQGRTVTNEVMHQKVAQWLSSES